MKLNHSQLWLLRQVIHQQDLTELQSIINKNERDDDSLIPSLPDERSNYILGRLINSREFIKLETLADFIIRRIKISI